MSINLVTKEYVDEKLLTFFPTSTWSDVQKVVKAGYGKIKFPVGTQFTTKHDSYGDIVWDVVAHDHFKQTSDPTAHTMTLQTHNCVTNMTFDIKQAWYCSDTDLPTGTYHFTCNRQPWVASDKGKTFQFTTTQVLTAGQQLVLDGEHTATYAGKTLIAYSGPSSTTALWSVTISEGSEGTDLGSDDGSSTDINIYDRAALGSNNYKQSGIRSWLNSDSNTLGGWWTAQTKFDRIYGQNVKSFFTGLPTDFRNTLTTVTIPCSTNDVYETVNSDTPINSKYTLNDTLYLLSQKELNGGTSTIVPDDSSVLEFYKNATNTNRIKYLSTVAKMWWTRSPSTGITGSVKVVNAAGGIVFHYAKNPFGVAPACTIG